MIQILFFASLRDAVDVADESIAADNINKVQDIIDLLYQRGGAWAEAFGKETSLLMSVNQEMANPEDTIGDGDEVGFFPPVTGG